MKMVGYTDVIQVFFLVLGGLTKGAALFLPDNRGRDTRGVQAAALSWNLFPFQLEELVGAVGNYPY
jgi:hypothetical protein